MNREQEKIKIHINLAGRQYPIKVLPQQEEIIRKAGKFLEKRINEVEKIFEISDIQDILSIILIEIASELLLEKENNKKQSQLIHEKMDQLLKL
jgi:cell division protein ZapA